jgi:hypothetical protein
MAFKHGNHTLIDLDTGNDTKITSAAGSDIVFYPDQHIWIKQGTKLIFEGTVPDDFEAKLQATSVTADRDIILPDEDGTLATQAYVTGAVTGGALSNTDALAEGSTNLYYTNTRARTEIEGADLDLAGNKVLFANKYDNLVDLPNATTYHGMFAHVHATGLAYYAHGGNWIALATQAGAGDGLSSSDFTSFHGSVYVVTNTDATTNASATVTITFSDLTNAKQFNIFLNRQLLRPDEFSVSGTDVTFNIGLLDENDEIEVSGFKIVT